MLTPKQELFVQNIIKGMSQADAYRNAYNAKRMSDNAIYREASLLMSSPKIAQRLSEITAKADKTKIMNAQKRLEWLTGIVESELESTGDKLKAIDLMNKMQGEYVTKVVGNLEAKLEDLL